MAISPVGAWNIAEVDRTDAMVCTPLVLSIATESKMTNDMRPAERLIRVALGLALLSCVFAFSGELRWAGLVGLFPLATGLFAWCPFYVLMDWLTLD